MEVILTGQVNLSAAEANAAGLVSRVVPADTLLNEAMSLAGMIAANSTMSVRMAKEAINRVYESGLSEGLMYERRLFYASLATADKAEGTRAFVEKRQPRFTDSGMRLSPLAQHRGHVAFTSRTGVRLPVSGRRIR